MRIEEAQHKARCVVFQIASHHEVPQERAEMACYEPEDPPTLIERIRASITSFYDGVDSWLHDR